MAVGHERRDNPRTGVVHYDGSDGSGGDWQMDRAALVHRRKKRYMAQTLDIFERTIEPYIPADVAEDFKGTVRRKLHALALDANEIHGLPQGAEINGAFIELRDQLADDQRSHTA